jgi:hypothetical protein
MSRRVRWLLSGSIMLLTLAGCGRGFMNYETREPWRHDAEVACLSSGTVKEGAGVVRISPIEGPGMCGADFPLKVSALGEAPALGYVDQAMRPPGAIPGVVSGAAESMQPRWPIQQQPMQAPPSYSPPAQAGAPMSIEAPGGLQQQRDYGQPSQQLGAPPSYLRAPPDWQRSRPGASSAPRASATPPIDEEEQIEELPPYARQDGPPMVPSRPAPPAQPQMQPLPPLGPPRYPQLAAATPVEIRPAATLACPIVSALDRWLANAVQPTAQKWFGQQVIEIKQISAYSCRGMNGNPNAHISEHAFGNALDIAAFVLADGHRITVKDGWHGSAEEQGFLRDVQGSACDQFTTVLAPGSNRFHYDHIHVDLMRRASGRRICQPGAVDGDVVAARVRRNPVYASRPIEPPPTRRYDPAVDPANDPFAWRGDRRGDPATTGSVAARRPGVRSPADEDNDWIEEPGPRPAIDWSTDRTKVY